MRQLSNTLCEQDVLPWPRNGARYWDCDNSQRSTAWYTCDINFSCQLKNEAHIYLQVVHNIITYDMSFEKELSKRNINNMKRQCYDTQWHLCIKVINLLNFDAIFHNKLCQIKLFLLLNTKAFNTNKDKDNSVVAYTYANPFLHNPCRQYWSCVVNFDICMALNQIMLFFYILNIMLYFECVPIDYLL